MIRDMIMTHPIPNKTEFIIKFFNDDKMTAYSKEYLRSLKTDHNIIQIVERVKNVVLKEARSGKTRYVYSNMWEVLPQHIKPETMEYSKTTQKFIKYLQQSFPDCIVEQREVIDLYGNKQVGIIIDWS